MAERRALHAYLSQDSHAGWNEFAEANGVTVSALVEAMGAFWHEQIAKGADPVELDPFLADAARTIDAQRRRRRT